MFLSQSHLHALQLVVEDFLFHLLYFLRLIDYLVHLLDVSFDLENFPVDYFGTLPELSVKI